MSERLVVITPHIAGYLDPIAVATGDALTLTGRSDDWHGHLWLWAIAGDGRQGWVPDNLVDSNQPAPQLAHYAYSAIELTCNRDEWLTPLHSSHGWTWCRNEHGGEGWVPEENLSQRTP